MPRVILEDDIYNLCADVIERKRCNADFIRKRLSCSDVNAKNIIKQMQDLGVVGNYNLDLYFGYEVLFDTLNEFNRRFISSWESKGFPRGA